MENTTKSKGFVLMLTEERYEELADKLETCIDSCVEYECEHDDAGSNYSHLPKEGGWAYHNGAERLLAWCNEHHAELAVTADEIESLEDEILDWCDYRPGSMFDITRADEFNVASYEVGEVEDQFCLPDLLSILEMTEDEAIDFLPRVNEDRRFCLRWDRRTGEILSYTNTDSWWVFYITKEWLVDRLEGIRD